MTFFTLYFLKHHCNQSMLKSIFIWKFDEIPKGPWEVFGSSAHFLLDKKPYSLSLVIEDCIELNLDSKDHYDNTSKITKHLLSEMCL
jgi:hypothetical protein